MLITPDITSKISPQDGEASLQGAVESIWRNKWLVIVITFISTVIAGGIAWSLPKTYQAVAVISAVSSSPGNGPLGALNSITSQFGGLASLAGISSGTDSKKSESLAVLQSEALTERYIQANNLLPVLFPKQWDAETMRWKDNNPAVRPTLWKANQLFKNQVRAVSSDLKTGLVTVSIKWQNPQVAAKWANDLIKVTNDYLRDKATAESERNIAYLNEQAAKTSVVEARQAIYSLLQTELNKLMLARGSEEFAFKILDPAEAPEKAYSPQKLTWLVVGMTLGFLTSISIILIRQSWK